jgi:hypothetical protein
MTLRSGGFGNGSSTTTGWRPSCECFSRKRKRYDVADHGEVRKTRIYRDEYEPLPGAPPPIPCTVLDPFAGAGTTLMVALRLGRQAIGIELNPDYVEMARRRITKEMEKAA